MIAKDYAASAEPPIVLYRNLIAKAFTSEEAANLVAYIKGVPIIADKPWKIQEISGILYIKYISEKNRKIESN